MMVQIAQSCGCFFVYEEDHSRPYEAKWVLCGKSDCYKSQARIEKAKMQEEIRIAEERLVTLQSEFARRFR